MEPKLTQPTLDVKEVSYTPKIMPIKEVGEVFEYGDEEYIPEEGDVIHKIKRMGSLSSNTKFTLVKSISGLNYFFRLNVDEAGHSGLAFKTLEYEYSRTNLDEEQKEILFKTIADFLESVNKNTEVEDISISPSDSSYKVEDVEECIQEMLKSKIGISEESLRNNYKGYKVFRLYEEELGKEFVSVNGRGENQSEGKAFARSRYFKSGFKKYLKYWEIVEDGWSKSIFSLKRKV